MQTSGRQDAAGNAPIGSSAAGVSFVVHHLGIAVPDMEAAIRSYQEALGLVLVGGPVDDPIQRVRVCFLASSPSSEVSLELISPLAGSSPIDQYLSKGVGAYHVCYRVADMPRALEHMRAAGCVLVSGPVPATAFGGKPIAWLLLPSRQLVELVEGGSVETRISGR